MTDLVVLVPSRERPHAARELAEAFKATCTADTELVFAVDEDDSSIEHYSAIAAAPVGLNGPFVDQLHPRVSVCVDDEPTSMVHALNGAAAVAATCFSPQPFAVGFMGDDHRPRTRGWDAAYLKALRELGTGIVYGDDLLQRQNLPTQCAMTADIVRELGFMAPPALTHMYVDNFWLALGTAADCVQYLPDVVVEHLHPVAGKAQWDAGYVRVNDPSMYHRDGAVFADYVRDFLANDVEKVRALRRVDA
jgi:hypothetical protein